MEQPGRLLVWLGTGIRLAPHAAREPFLRLVTGRQLALRIALPWGILRDMPDADSIAPPAAT